MDGENWNPTGDDRGFDHKPVEIPFCEDLLSCHICEKIYFSRQPINLPTLCSRSFCVCLDCSDFLECSVCGKDVSPSEALVVENLPDSAAGLLCPRCKTRILKRFRAAPQSGLKRFLSSLALMPRLLLERIRQILRKTIPARRKGRKEKN